VSTVDPGVTAPKPVNSAQQKKIRKRSPPSERGTHAYSVPQAGRMVGLSRAASYAAAKRGEIPTIPFGDRFIVPRSPWHRKLGIED
jgi:hypothetical protein